MTTLELSILTAAAMGVACAVLSVFVVLRRWAFIGEGIAHAGFGGAGTAWLLALLFPSATFLMHPAGVFAVAVVFCLLTALAIGWVSREERVRVDTAIGIFLVTSLAWGFIAQRIYTTVHTGHTPPDWDAYLWGHLRAMPPAFTAAVVVVCAAVLAVVTLLKKEIVYYCFDPAMAEASGVRSGFIHYLLILLVALTIIIGARVAGSVLVTALLVLPGATALLLSDRLRTTVAGSVVVGLAGAAAAVLVRWRYPLVPMGPAIVLAMFALFLLAYAWSRVTGARGARD